MNITIIGTGYVGLVTGVCLSDVGNNIICLDIDEAKIKKLKNGICPIYEPGLEQKLTHGLESGNLKFTSNSKKAIEKSDLIFIAVGTPSLSDGGTDLSFIKSAAKTIAENLNSDKIVVTKSTVPVGTTHLVGQIIEELSNNDYNVNLASNPEFLKEGKAVEDFQYPDRIVVGAEDKETLKKLKDLYKPFNLRRDKVITMDIKSSELTKYAANAMLATKISFINEIANICERIGANINKVREGIGSDSRIGFDFIYPGIGFGGSCVPKDLRSIKIFSESAGYDTNIIDAVISVNEAQKKIFAHRVVDYFKTQQNKEKIKIAVWGLSFKPETDDVRESPGIDIIKVLLDNGMDVIAFDPIAIDNFKKNISHDNLSFGKNKYEILDGVDALILCTQWNEFKNPDYKIMISLMKTPVIFDGKNIYDKEKLENLGFKHFQVGVKS